MTLLCNLSALLVLSGLARHTRLPTEPRIRRRNFPVPQVKTPSLDVDRAYLLLLLGPYDGY